MSRRSRSCSRGTILRTTAHFDNSAANPLNPDPSARVKLGLQSWDEMMGGVIFLAYDKDVDSPDLKRYREEDRNAACSDAGFSTLEECIRSARAVLRDSMVEHSPSEK